MKVVLDGEAGALVGDWTLHITTRPGGGFDFEVERRVKGASERMSIENAMAFFDLLTTSSFPANKVAIFPGPKR